MTVQRVLDLASLLGHRSSQRLIARIVGISRTTVAAILTGRRTIGQRLARGRVLLPEIDGPVGRCGICGAKVRLPCRACLVRSILAQTGIRCNDPDPGGDLRLGVDLRGSALRRYRELLRRRLRGCRGQRITEVAT